MGQVRDSTAKMAVGICRRNVESHCYLEVEFETRNVEIAALSKS
jgi:hypothetical protein